MVDTWSQVFEAFFKLWLVSVYSETRFMLTDHRDLLKSILKATGQVTKKLEMMDTSCISL